MLLWLFLMLIARRPGTTSDRPTRAVMRACCRQRPCAHTRPHKNPGHVLRFVEIKNDMYARFCCCRHQRQDNDELGLAFTTRSTHTQTHRAEAGFISLTVRLLGRVTRPVRVPNVSRPKTRTACAFRIATNTHTQAPKPSQPCQPCQPANALMPQ